MVVLLLDSFRAATPVLVAMGSTLALASPKSHPKNQRFCTKTRHFGGINTKKPEILHLFPEDFGG